MKTGSGLSVFLICFAAVAIAQTTKQVQGTGTTFIAGDVSPNLAKVTALNEAKMNALRNAGIKENINSYQLLLTSQQNNDYHQLFSSDIQSEMQGAIQSYTTQSERIFCRNETEIVCEVKIAAVVIQYETRPDPAFNVDVQGVKSVYNNDDKLVFNIKTTQPAYLTVFNITDSEASVLYPNPFEKPAPCKIGQTYTYPSEKIDYILHTDKKETEMNRLIFVFTKKPASFIKMNEAQETNSDLIFSWLYSIPPDERKVEYRALTIQK